MSMVRRGKKKKKHITHHLKCFWYSELGGSFLCLSSLFWEKGAIRWYTFFFLEGVKRLGGAWGTEKVQLI